MVAFRNLSPVSVHDKRVLHLDTSLFFKQNSTEHYHSMDDDNDDIDFSYLPRPPSLSLEYEQSSSLDIQRSDTDSAVLGGTPRSWAHNDDDADTDSIHPPTFIEVPDEQCHDHSEELTLMTQLRQELYDEESCLQLTLEGNVSVCHDDFPDFAKALRKSRKHHFKSKPNKTRTERRKGRLLNLMHNQ